MGDFDGWFSTDEQIGDAYEIAAAYLWLKEDYVSLCRFVYTFCIGTALDQLGLPWGPKRCMMHNPIESQEVAAIKEKARQHFLIATEWRIPHNLEQNDITNLWKILTQSEERPDSPPKCLLNVEVPHPDFVKDKVWLSCLAGLSLEAVAQRIDGYYMKFHDGSSVNCAPRPTAPPPDAEAHDHVEHEAETSPDDALQRVACLQAGGDTDESEHSEAEATGVKSLMKRVASMALGGAAQQGAPRKRPTALETRLAPQSASSSTPLLDQRDDDMGIAAMEEGAGGVDADRLKPTGSASDTPTHDQLHDLSSATMSCRVPSSQRRPWTQRISTRVAIAWTTNRSIPRAAALFATVTIRRRRASVCGPLPLTKDMSGRLGARPSCVHHWRPTRASSWRWSPCRHTTSPVQACQDPGDRAAFAARPAWQCPLVACQG